MSANKYTTEVNKVYYLALWMGDPAHTSFWSTHFVNKFLDIYN